MITSTKITIYIELKNLSYIEIYSAYLSVIELLIQLKMLKQRAIPNWNTKKFTTEVIDLQK